MPIHIALLRAVNVGVTGKLPMAELRTLCEGLGFRHVRTYNQSGNLVCSSTLDAAKFKAKLEKALAARMGKPCRVLVRSVDEMQKVVDRNPFPEAPPNQLLVIFLDEAPPKSALASCVVPGREQLALRGRDLFMVCVGEEEEQPWPPMVIGGHGIVVAQYLRAAVNERGRVPQTWKMSVKLRPHRLPIKLPA